jgi:ribonuclease H / adenosylcobalamin/alpha-ribazole phosphatase
VSAGSSVIVEADGGSRGNPGPAGYGAVVRDAATGAVLAERAGGLGVTTNNVAEYSGLIAGLLAALELGATEVEVRMDSKLVVEQLTGRWQVKHPGLQPLARDAAELVRQLGRVRFTWVPRSANKHADALANAAMDAQASGGTWSPAPSPEPSDQEPVPDEDPVLSAPAVWSGAKGAPTRFLLLRHGQTAYSAEHRYSGRGDLPLTPLGERQAEALAKRMSTVDGVAAVVSSPLRRCTRTAELVAAGLGVPLTVHNGLIEADFGAWEGLTFAEAATRDPQLHPQWLSDSSIAPPGGESFDAVHLRVRRARDELIAEHGAATIVVVSHVTPIKALLRMALAAGPSVLYRLHLDIASLSTVEFYPDGGAAVRLFNDTSHL